MDPSSSLSFFLILFLSHSFSSSHSLFLFLSLSFSLYRNHSLSTRRDNVLLRFNWSTQKTFDTFSIHLWTQLADYFNSNPPPVPGSIPAIEQIQVKEITRLVFCIESFGAICRDAHGVVIQTEKLGGCHRRLSTRVKSIQSCFQLFLQLDLHALHLDRSRRLCLSLSLAHTHTRTHSRTPFLSPQLSLPLSFTHANPDTRVVGYNFVYTMQAIAFKNRTIYQSGSDRRCVDAKPASVPEVLSLLFQVNISLC